MPNDNEFTRILQWPGYRVYRQKIDENNKVLELWVRRKRGNRKLACSGCGRKFADAYDSNERAVRDRPWSGFRTTVHIEVYRVKCPDCGVKVEKVPLLPSKAPFSKRFEDAVGQACEGAVALQVVRRLVCRRARCARSIGDIWSDGPRPGASRRCGKWAWTRFTWERSRSSSRWCATWRG